MGQLKLTQYRTAYNERAKTYGTNLPIPELLPVTMAFFPLRSAISEEEAIVFCLIVKLSTACAQAPNRSESPE